MAGARDAPCMPHTSPLLLLIPALTACASARPDSANATRCPDQPADVVAEAPCRGLTLGWGSAPGLGGTTPPRHDLRATAAPLDRARTASLEAFSADGATALLRLEDSLRGPGHLLLRLDGTVAPRALPGGTPALLQTALRALGRDRITRLSARHPTLEVQAIVLERPDAHAVILAEDLDGGPPDRGPQGQAATPAPVAQVASGRPFGPDRACGLALLALLPRAPGASPAGYLAAWAPGGRQLFVRVRERSDEPPHVERDSWFALQVDGSPGP